MKQAVSKHKGNVVMVLNFGSQYTHLIPRRVRQLGVCSVCLPGTVPLPTITSYAPSLVILSGGPHSVHEPGAPSLTPSFFDYTAAHNHAKPAFSQEYGRMDVQPLSGSMLFGDGPLCIRLSVWMSHGDEAVELPDGFSVVCKSLQGGIAAIKNPSLGIYGLQFHPEVTHTVHGIEILKQILFDVSGITADWKLQDVLEEQLELIKSTVGSIAHAICALSGGVDSNVDNFSWSAKKIHSARRWG
ncbi:hypothetical protein L7F22_028056 [Adiantum nelumboides]|nr:hypothetical protein [Adiantum nelumboides]